MKRACDIVLGFLAVTSISPIVLFFSILIAIFDFSPPFYIGVRVGKNGKHFRFAKLRSMVVNADKAGIDTTIKGDPRVTFIGRIIRNSKIDELPQFWHVFVGTMSLVGPRPNIEREVVLYTDEERRLLSVKPGITDLSSIVFNNLADVLADHEDPNIAYAQFVRSWKSRLGLWYIDNQSLALDFEILILTLISIVAPGHARRNVSRLLSRRGAQKDLVDLPLRTFELRPTLPPGTDKLLTKEQRISKIARQDN